MLVEIPYTCFVYYAKVSPKDQPTQLAAKTACCPHSTVAQHLNSL